MLYIVNKTGEVLVSCIERATADDVVLLIEEAVYAAVDTNPPSVLSELISHVAVYALTPDMQARGVEVKRCYEYIKYVDYTGFVELIENNKPVRSCF